MNSYIILRKCLVILFLSITMLQGTSGGAIASTESELDKSAVISFDATIELYAPNAKTYIVLFARYWVSSTNYRMALIWGEPHAGNFNFPIYAPTMNVASDAHNFLVEHQFKHQYDGIFTKPIEQRGHFFHKFNTYTFSDIKFAERDALDLRIRADDINFPQILKSHNNEQTFDVNNPGSGRPSSNNLSRIIASTSNGCLEGLQLLGPDGNLLKGIEYEYADKEGERDIIRQTTLLPEQPITVGFKGKKPVVTINGKKNEISQFDMMHHSGGRECLVNYKSINLGGHQINMPVNITVKNGKSGQVLRSAKMYNFTYSKLSSDQIDEAAKKFSYFTDNEMKCREMLVKYWVKEPADVNKADVVILKQLFEHFSKQSTDGLSISEQVRHINVLLQLDWMLGRANRLENDFREYLSLLATQNLDRLILDGGHNIIELTTRWGQLETAEKLLDIWVKEAITRNKSEVILEFADLLLENKHYWTSAILMDRLIEKSQLSPDQQFFASVIQSVSKERLFWIINHSDDDMAELKEPEIIQANWVSHNVDSDILKKDLVKNIDETKMLFTKIDQPTRIHKALMEQINKIDIDTLDINTPKN